MKASLHSFLLSSLVAWGTFFILRLGLMLIRCLRLPEVSILEAGLLECADHLAAALASLLVWLWMVRRKLVLKGWSRTVLEGFAIALLLNTIITVLCFRPYSIIYGSEQDPFGVYEACILHYMSTPLWFAFVLAHVYVQHSRALQKQRTAALDAARSAQLKILRGQLNPHFLFNSFNSIRALMHSAPERAGEAISQLSEMLRYTLTCTDSLFVPLARELDIVTRYLDLEKLRLGSRLAVTRSIDSTVLRTAFPPLILQSLIENAVKYGPASSRNGGEVHYSIARFEQQLFITVTNTGSLKRVSDSTTIGLYNLRRRLHLLFEDAASFSLREGPGPSVVAEVRIPLSSPFIQSSPHEK